ncbi:MAG: DUF5663 domain-containing protein [Candidatus Saccharibacteria bacterium]|nr:DUF5663 domain-containing protein [Candidatus Saccharibacteria bacterium]
MQKIDEFIEDLLNKKGLSGVDEEAKKDLITEMKTQLEEQLNRAAVQALPEEKAKELADLVDKPDFTTKEMAKFMQESGVDFNQIALETMQKFAKLYLGEEA